MKSQQRNYFWHHGYYCKFQLTSNGRFLEYDDFDGNGFLHRDENGHVKFYTLEQMREALARFTKGYESCNLPVPNLEVLGYNDANQRIIQGVPTLELLRMHDESCNSHNSSWYPSRIQRPAEFISPDVPF